MSLTLRDSAKEYLDGTLYLEGGVNNEKLIRADDSVAATEKAETGRLTREESHLQARIDAVEGQKAGLEKLAKKTTNPHGRKAIEGRINDLKRELESLHHEQRQVAGLKESAPARVKSGFEDALWTECAKNAVILESMRGLGISSGNYHGHIIPAIFRMESACDSFATVRTLAREPEALHRRFQEATVGVDLLGINFTDEDKIAEVMDRVKMHQAAWEQTPEAERSKQSPKELFGSVIEILKKEHISKKNEDDWVAWLDPKQQKPLEEYVEDCHSWAEYFHGMRKEWIDKPIIWSEEAAKVAVPLIKEHPGKSLALAVATGIGLYYGGKYIPVVLKAAKEYPKFVAGAEFLFGVFTAVSTGKTGKDMIDGVTTQDPEKSSRLLEKSGGETPMRVLELLMVGGPIAAKALRAFRASRGVKGMEEVGEGAKALEEGAEEIRLSDADFIHEPAFVPAAKPTAGKPVEWASDLDVVELGDTSVISKLMRDGELDQARALALEAATALKAEGNWAKSVRVWTTYLDELAETDPARAAKGFEEMAQGIRKQYNMITDLKVAGRLKDTSRALLDTLPRMYSSSVSRARAAYLQAARMGKADELRGVLRVFESAIEDERKAKAVLAVVPPPAELPMAAKMSPGAAAAPTERMFPIGRRTLEGSILPQFDGAVQLAKAQGDLMAEATVLDHMGDALMQGRDWRRAGQAHFDAGSCILRKITPRLKTGLRSPEDMRALVQARGQMEKALESFGRMEGARLDEGSFHQAKRVFEAINRLLG